MDLYTSALVLGGVGLALMAISGLSARGGDHGSHGSHGHGGHHGHGHAGEGLAGHHAAPGAHTHSTPHVGHSHAGNGHTVPGQAGQGHHHGHEHTASGGNRLDSVMALLSPRVWFSVSVGFGTAGVLLRGVLGGPILFAAAAAVGVAFEWLLVAPFWRFLFRFASSPALTLESSIQDLARAVTSFDARGQGLVSIDLDGQVIQILATLRPEDRAAGARVRAGDEVRIEDVDNARNRCTVSITHLRG